MALQTIATAVLASHVRSETRKAGALGVLAGLAATTILRRSVPGAIVIGGVVVARELIKIKRKADAKREAEAKAAARLVAERAGEDG